jgi:hypothetical protein
LLRPIETGRLLTYLQCEHLRSFRLSAGGIGRTLVLQLTSLVKSEKDVAALEVRANMPSMDDRALLPLLEALATDTLLQETVFRIGFPTRAGLRTGTSRPLLATVAVRQGRFQLQSLREAEQVAPRLA